MTTRHLIAAGSTCLSRRSFLLGAAALGAAAMTAGCRPVEARPGAGPTAVVGAPARLFTNGAIYIDADRKVSNLLVAGGIVQGWDVAPADHPAAEIVDLAGAALYPGFIDSHVHFESSYFFAIGANLMGCTNAGEIAAALAEKVKSIPEDGFVLGLGFAPPDYDLWSLADLAQIDAVTGPRPAILVDKLGHNAIANTALMQLAGLTPESPVPLGGKMGSEDGRLTGMMRESAMNPPLTALVALFDFDQIKAAMLGFLQRWAANGYTGCVDLMGGPGFRFMYPEVFWELEQEGKLPLRAGYCYTIFNLDDVDGAMQYVGRDTALTHFVGCKIFVDGAFAGGQAWTSWTNEQGGHGLQEIYTDDRGGPGLNLNRIVARVEALGLNMHYHTQGDLAIGAVLDALDQVKAARGAIRGIHTLIHLAFPTDEQIARIHGFGGQVVTTTQPGFWEVEQGTEYYYGAHAAEAYPIQKLIAAGLSVGISTDWSVSPYDYAPATAVIGIAATGDGHPDLHRPVSVRDAIHGLTVGSAATTGRRDIGRLDVGYQADMVLYDRDLYTLAPEAFAKDNPRVVATWLRGEKTEARMLSADS